MTTGARACAIVLAGLILGGDSAAAQKEHPLQDTPATARRGDPPSAAAREAPRRVSGRTAAALFLSASPVDGGSIQIDGLADEPAWAAADVATDFVQFQPADGEPATERTEARVVYGEDALYVFMHAFEPDPDLVVGQLTRRDQDSHSDLLGVAIDSYFDRRTAFHFSVNPVGVKHDVYRFDDTSEDSGWDAVWEVQTRRTADGWSAEFRIPYSQLRFRDAEEQSWGINFEREIARKQEVDVWSPTSRADGAIVSRFGELRGLRGLSAPNRMEVLPYSLASLQRAPGDPSDPFYAENETFGTAGVDVKYGVTSDLTLDVTINPDFGQVEADPAQVNLSAFEVFLPERRPFFVEGSSIFNFGIGLGDGNGGAESLFYSRRVGRTPQGSADPNGGFVDVDDRTTILGAWKLSGKTGGGWSIGALHALTAEERALVAPASGDRYREAVEPRSNYGVLRVQKDFREGRSAVGIIGTGLARDRAVADALELRSRSWAGGLDFRHRFASDTWQLNGYVLASHVSGSAETIARTQRSPAHNYQRPDASHLTYDPERTSLSGLSTNFGISKNAGGFWRVGTGVQTRTPGFEVNDVGFQNNADEVISWQWLGYHHTTAQGPFRRWFANLNSWQVHDFEGNRIGTGGNLNLNGQLQNFWNVYAGVNRELESLSAGLLRGGPLFLREGSTNAWGGFGTDSRRAVQINLNGWVNVRPESDSRAYGVSPNLRIRPSGRATFNLGAFINRNRDDRQWVASIETSSPHYVFGRIDQTTVGVTARVDFAFTPTLSVQLYAQPFVSAGSYDRFRQVADPVADRYADRFSGVATRLDDGRYYADLDGDGTDEDFRAPDFNFKQFRSNAVLRWEYRPGSTLFVVWSQGRDHYIGAGAFDFAGDVDRLFDSSPDDVFMVKFSYWMSR